MLSSGHRVMKYSSQETASSDKSTPTEKLN